jgi:four helix bundle protein
MKDVAMFGFEKLAVWQRAIQFAERTYDLTMNFRRTNGLDLRTNCDRATVSIAANIAEGSGRGSSKDFKRFIEIAYGSLMETVSHIRIANSRRFLTDPDHQDLYQSAEELAKMLSGLKSSLNS